MIFILLIFFVVSTTFSKLPGTQINKPEASHSDRLSPNQLLIGITQTGDIYINGIAYTHNTLTEKLHLKLQSNPRTSVVIVADKESVLKHTITVMDICKTVGITNIAIAEELVHDTP